MRFKTRSIYSRDAEQPSRLDELPPEKLNDIREVFTLFDLDSSGTIDASELVQVFGTLGQDIGELEAAEIIKSLDRDGDGELSFEEFAEYFCQNHEMESEDTDTMIRNMFAIFDKNDDGDISTQEFASVLQRLGNSLSVDDIQAVIDEVDINGDGQISLEEFEVMVRKHLLTQKRVKKRKKSRSSLRNVLRMSGKQKT